MSEISDLGEYPFLIRVPGESPWRRFVATDEVTAEGAREAGWEVFDLRVLLAKAAGVERADQAFRDVRLALLDNDLEDALEIAETWRRGWRERS